MEMPSAGERLVSAGSEYFPNLLLLFALILGLGIAVFIILEVINAKRPPEEKKSHFYNFLFALVTSFFIAVLYFVYRMVLIGLEHLSQ